MSKICILSHFCSCNLGDRNQGKSIFLHLLQNNIKFFNIKCVNFVDISDKSDENKSIENFSCNDHFIVYGPSYILDKNIEFNMMIVVTGTLSYSSYFLSKLDKLKNNVTNKIFLWGGLNIHDIYGGLNVNDARLSDYLHLFDDNKFVFISRSFLDTDLFSYLSSTNAILGADPLLKYCTDKHNDIKNIDVFGNNIIDLTNKKIYVPSFYFYEKFDELFEKLVAHSDIIICVDNGADYDLIDIFTKHKKTYYFINDPDVFINIIQKSKIVISNRLHPALLSACSSVNTIVIPSGMTESDCSPEYIKNDTVNEINKIYNSVSSNSFKYISVFGHSFNINKPLCKIIDVENIHNFDFINENHITQEYKNNCQKYISIFRKIMEHIIKQC